MKQERLMFYNIDMKYVRNLAKKDDTVRSISPQQGKANRPFVGIVVVCEERKYCIPLSSPKPKHKDMGAKRDLLKIMVDGKNIGVLNFNSMIPVDEVLIKPVVLKVYATDSPSIKHYKNMTKKQLNWCQKNQEQIVHKANQLYKLVTESPEDSINLTRRCCDFQKLEAVLEKYIKKLFFNPSYIAVSNPKNVKETLDKHGITYEISPEPNDEGKYALKVNGEDVEKVKQLISAPKKNMTMK